MSGGSEGPFAQALIAAASGPDGTRYEVAVFELPRQLAPAERAALLEQVESGLTAARSPGGRPRVADSSLGGRSVRQLELALPEGGVGCWLVLFPGARHLLQLSVVGPDRHCHEAGVQRFFQSFEWLERPAEPEPSPAPR